MNINRKEIERYLGYKGNTPDDNVKQVIDEAVDEILKIATPKSVYKILPLKTDGININFGSVNAVSKNLGRNLLGCKEIVVFAATLGIGVDNIIKKYSMFEMSKAVVLQACAAAMIEDYCDECQKKIADELLERGLYLRPRFSPGYGDFDINNQEKFVNILESSKKIGLSLTNSFILVPTKSVTAVMGITENEEKCHIKGCEVCTKKDCLFRRDG